MALEQRLRTEAERTGLNISHRDSHELPSRLPNPPDSWTEPYATLATEVGVEANLEAAYAIAGRFLDPVLDGTATGVWESQTGDGLRLISSSELTCLLKLTTCQPVGMPEKPG